MRDPGLQTGPSLAMVPFARLMSVNVIPTVDSARTRPKPVRWQGLF